VVANSWQQTPAGHHVVPMLRDGRPLVIDGQPVLRAEIVDFWALIFNPSSIHRLVHVWIGAFILGSFFIMSISAYYLLRDRHLEFAKRSFAGALLFATLASLAAVVSGHFQARSVYRFQPAKLAAFEAHYRTGPGDLSLIGLPDDAAETIRFKAAIPGGLSFLVHDDFDEPVIGLDRFRRSDRPPVLLSFASYHIMIGLGALFIVLTVTAAFLHWRRRLYQTRWLLWVFVLAVVGPVLANELGWVSAEVGRQPWVVHPPVSWTEQGDLVVGPDGVVEYDESLGLRTADAVSSSVAASQVLGSIVGFGLIYLGLFAVWLYVLDSKIRHGPDAPPAPEPGLAGGVLSAAARLRDHSESLTGSAGSP